MQKAGAVSSLPLVMQAGRIGIREARNLPWRWYLRASRSVSRRARGDRPPRASISLASLWLDSHSPYPETVHPRSP